MSEIIPFPSAQAQSSPIASYFRIGDNHHQIESIFEQGKFQSRRVVMDGHLLKNQKDLRKTFIAEGLELTLDTKMAEIASAAKFAGKVRHISWSNLEGEVDTPQLFLDRQDSIVHGIAEAAVANGFHRVLAPAHLLQDGVLDEWFNIDLDACELLRRTLDDMGGKGIAIDYQLLLDRERLDDDAERGVILERLSELPCENIWIRAGKFGAGATGQKIRKHINALHAFDNLGKPIITDHIGGLAGRALLAFGATSGISRGIGDRDSFATGGWDKFPKPLDPDKRFGQPKRTRIFGFDKSLSAHELRALASAHGGSRHVVCGDRSCCPHGLESMLANPINHFLTQERKAMEKLESLNDTFRAEGFLSGELKSAERNAFQIKSLTPDIRHIKPRSNQTAEDARERFVKRNEVQHKKIDRMRSILENFVEVSSLTSRKQPFVHTNPNASLPRKGS